jgi:hypothetical protein
VISIRCHDKNLLKPGLHILVFIDHHNGFRRFSITGQWGYLCSVGLGRYEQGTKGHTYDQFTATIIIVKKLGH